MTNTPTLHWFADDDGVHRLRKREDDRHEKDYRAAVSALGTSWVWIAWPLEIGPHQSKEGLVDTLELAKSAAEEAVQELESERKRKTPRPV